MDKEEMEWSDKEMRMTMPHYDPNYSERGYYIAPVTDKEMTKMEMVNKLKEWMKTNDNPEMKKAISDCITVMEK